LIKTLLSDKRFLGFELSVYIVEITRGLQRTVTNAEQRLICGCVLALLHQPACRLGNKIDAKKKWYGWDECRAELKSPSYVAAVKDGQVSRKAKHNAKSHPHLPGHNKGTSDICWCVLGREDWNCDFFQTHANAQENAADKDLWPALGDSLTNRTEETEDTAYKNGSTATDEIVDWIRQPT